jgi:nucleotide-binding universal stress UspA family protein
MSETYTVVLMVEQALSAADATQVRSLHEGLDDEVRYHVLLPAEDAAARVEAAMGTLGGDNLTGAPPMPPDPETIEIVREETERQSTRDLQATLEALHAAGAEADGDVVDGDPIEALAATVARVDGREAIILTRSHVVSEFFHMDWSSRARRAIGVPVLHLLEHESFDEQAGSGEGVTGL